jgi:hypothetical protein
MSRILDGNTVEHHIDSNEEDEHVATTPILPDNITPVLPLLARQVIKTLHSDGVIYSDDKPKFFDYILRNKEIISSYLYNMGIMLRVSNEDKLAFIERVGAEGIDDADENDENVSDNSVSIMRTPRALTLYQSLVLLQLRSIFHEKENQGDSLVYCDKDTLESLLSTFSSINDTSKKQDRDINGAIDYFAKHKLVKRAKTGSNRILIRPLIKYVVTLDYKDQMISDYVKIAQSNGVVIPKELIKTLPMHLQSDLFGTDDESDQNNKDAE